MNPAFRDFGSARIHRPQDFRSLARLAVQENTAAKSPHALGVIHKAPSRSIRIPWEPNLISNATELSTAASAGIRACPARQEMIEMKKVFDY